MPRKVSTIKEPPGRRQEAGTTFPISLPVKLRLLGETVSCPSRALKFLSRKIGWQKPAEAERNRTGNLPEKDAEPDGRSYMDALPRPLCLSILHRCCAPHLRPLRSSRLAAPTTTACTATLRAGPRVQDTPGAPPTRSSQAGWEPRRAHLKQQTLQSSE